VLPALLPSQSLPDRDRFRQHPDRLRFLAPLPAAVHL